MTHLGFRGRDLKLAASKGIEKVLELRGFNSKF